MKPKLAETKEMVGGCCVCSDENGWTENPLVYCDGLGCNVAVHQACYGIVAVPTGSWFCRKCESQERSARVRCELCPSKDGALKRTDSGGWAHVVCALYIPEVRFGNVTTMEPIMLQLVPQERFNKLCYLCEENSRGSKANIGACMQCNRSGCKNHFHVTCAQAMGLLCEEAGNYLDNVKYCGYCQYHYNKLRRGGNVKTIPPYRPVIHDSVSSDEEKKSSFNLDSKISKIKRRSSKSSPPPEPLKVIGKDNQSDPSTLIGHNKDQTNDSSNSLVSVKTDQNCGDSVQSVVSESKKVDSSKLSDKSSLNSSSVLNNSSANCVANKVPVSTRESEERKSNQSLVTTVASCPSVGSHPGKETSSETPPLSLSSVAKSESQTLSTTSSSGDKLKTTSSVAPVSLATLPPTSSTMEKDRYKRRNKSSPRSGSLPSQSEPEMTPSTLPDPDDKEEGVLTICEERNLSIDQEGTSSQEGAGDGKVNSSSSTSQSQKLEYQPQSQKLEYQQTDFSAQDPTKRSRSGSQDRGRRSKRGGSAYGNVGGISVKRGRFQGSSSSREAGKDGNAVGDDLPLQNLEPPLKRGRPCKVQEPKDSKEGLNSLITNGIGSSTALLLGNQINPTSSMAQRMADTLNAELEAHSIYKQEEKFSATLMGPTLPGKRDGATSGSVLNSAIPPPLPQSLEELLERQWEQGSQFLMEQAQHFDIASLLSCLHQLRQENVRLEETVGKLVARRDHLLAVNARLSVPLTSSQTTSSTGSSSTSGSPSSSSNVSTVASSVSSAAFAYANSISGISSTIAGQLAAASSSLSSATSGAMAGHGSAAAPTPNAASVLSSRHHSHQRLSGESGPNAHSSSGANNLGSRGASPHERRSHQTTPIENGLETEYRYRSPGSEHQHRQHSPMLPRGAQPSPTSMRQSPASASYHSSSPHSVVPSLSPSSGNPQAPPPHHQPPSHGGHAPPAHGGHSHVISSSHGSSHHTVSLSRVPDPSRAELVRLTSSQPHSSSHSTVSGYPVYQMVSPPVHGPHHSPVGLAQHPQVLRREVVESVRNSHPLDAKR